MIVLRTPKGWTGPKVVDGKPVEGTWRSHQVPLAELRENPSTCGLLEDWMQSYRPDQLFDEDGGAAAGAGRPRAQGRRRMGTNPHANGGVLLQPTCACRTFATTPSMSKRRAARRPRRRAFWAVICATS